MSDERASIYEVATALREAAITRLALVTACRPGDVLVVESDKVIPESEMREFRARLAVINEQLALKVIVLPPGLHVVTGARAEESFEQWCDRTADELRRRLYARKS